MKKKTGLRLVTVRDTRTNTGKIWRSSYDTKPWTKPHKAWIVDASQSDLKGELLKEMNEEWYVCKARYIGWLRILWSRIRIGKYEEFLWGIN